MPARSPSWEWLNCQRTTSTSTATSTSPAETTGSAFVKMYVFLSSITITAYFYYLLQVYLPDALIGRVAPPLHGRDWGGASSLRPSGSLTQTQSHKHLQDCYWKTYIFSSPVFLCTYPEQPVCTSLLFIFILLFIKSQYSFLHILLVCTFYSIAHFTLISLFLPYICSCVVLLLYNSYFVFFCTVHWADLIWLHFTSDYTLYNLLCDK